jgi:hypothetical protein
MMRARPSQKDASCARFSLILCDFARNYSEDLSGKLSNNSMRHELF